MRKDSILVLTLKVIGNSEKPLIREWQDAHGEPIKREQEWMWTKAIHSFQVGADVHLGLSRGNRDDAERQQEMRFHVSCDFMLANI